LPSNIHPKTPTAIITIEINCASVNPKRIKVRGPSFVNLAVIGELCKGHMIADVISILGSIDIVLGEVDR